MSKEKQQLQRQYDDIEAAVAEVKRDPSVENVNDLKLYINKYFEPARCLNLVYTQNIDKLFFGVYVFPKVTASTVMCILFGDSNDDRVIINEFDVELDSRLFDDRLDLTPAQITAVLIHDIGHLVNDSAPVYTVKKELDRYMAKTGGVLKIPESIHYRNLLAYGFADSMRKYTAIFEKDHYVSSELTDEFIDWCDFSGLITSAFNKASRLGYNHNREIVNKFIVFSWILRFYKDIAHNRIPAIMGIKTCIELSPSQIEKRELRKIVVEISNIDDSELLTEEASTLFTEVRNGITKSAYLHSYDSYAILEAVKEDIVDLVLRQDKVDANEPDGLDDLIGDINSKMSHIQDYVENDGSLSPIEVKQWNDMYTDLGKMRGALTKGQLFTPSKYMVNSYENSNVEAQ